MGVDKEPVEDDSEESDTNDEKDGEVKTLKVRLLSEFVLIVIDLPLPSMESLRWMVIIPLPIIIELDDFNGWDSRVRNIDDLILQAAIWDDKHWFGRSGYPVPF